ncbi:MAG: hypothetical protein PVJ43_13290 [Gemmatimonadales bacterium]|jgi:hypothetical protein
MIELKDDSLVFTFPEVHSDAVLRIEFQRTLRIPDDGKKHPLPPGLGEFPLRHVDDFAAKVPESWLEHGGVMLPMYQSEALWVNFRGSRSWTDSEYPVAVKVATGKINAVTGKAWENGLNRKPQDYLVVPEQPWLDGYCVAKGEIRQFVAMPLGAGYSAEEQITGAAEHGGLQIIAYPMKTEAYERYRKDRRFTEDHMVLAMAPAGRVRALFSMGLAPGGRMRQKIYDDTYDYEDWDVSHSSRCFVHIANSMVWRAITGQAAPTVPPTARAYTEAGLPWFDLYDEHVSAVEGGAALEGLKSVKELGEEKGEVPLPENESIDPHIVKKLRLGLKKHQVREGVF